jgi:hypothetical protein
MSGSVNLRGTTATTNWVGSKEAIIDWGLAGQAGAGTLAIPMGQTSSPKAGSIYFDEGISTLFVYDGSVWKSVVFS